MATYLDLTALALALGCSRWAARRIIACGDLPAIVADDGALLVAAADLQDYRARLADRAGDLRDVSELVLAAYSSNEPLRVTRNDSKDTP